MEENTSVKVIFHEGDYLIHRTAVFTEEDSGTATAPIVFTSAEGETVTFKGSREIDTKGFRPVTDSAILERLPKEARGKVGQLDLRAQGITDIPPNEGLTSYSQASNSHCSFFLNGKEQPISRWPNNGYAVIKSVTNKGGRYGKTGDISNTVFVAEDPVASRWGQAKDAVIAGYFNVDYAYEAVPLESVNPHENSITLGRQTYYGADTMTKAFAPRRWMAYNLLEEIDMPGEWYVDRKSMIMYFYPPHSLKDSTLEMSYVTRDLINMNKTSHVIMKGINFEQTCGTAIRLSNTDNITIENCDFRYIGGSAVVLYGTNNTVMDCDIHDIGDVGINSAGGDCLYPFDENEVFYEIDGKTMSSSANEKTFRSASNRIINNHIYRVARHRKTHAPGVSVFGVGHIVEHNVIHDSPGQGIMFRGNDHKIRYNELYDLVKEIKDAGAVYTGKSATLVGTEIAYNYFHDIMGEYNYRDDADIEGGEPIWSVQAVYLDDAQCGINIHHNIFKNTRNSALLNGGHRNTFANNIVIDAEVGITNWLEDDLGKIARFRIQTEGIKANPIFPLFMEKYPGLIEGLTSLPAKPAFNIIKDNLIVNSSKVVIAPSNGEYGTVENNIQVDEFNEFVDAEAQDFRIKTGSEMLVKIPGLLSDEFDISLIGLQITENRKTIEKLGNQFRQNFPPNKAQMIDPKKVTFHWDDEVFANSYRLIVAEDLEMNDVVYSGETQNNYKTISALEAGNKVYYWKVLGMNTSRQMANVWQNSQMPYVLSTSLYETTDNSKLAVAISEARRKISLMTEGTNPGEYPVGIKERLTEMINTSSVVLGKRLGQVTQAEVDQLTAELNNSVLNAAKQVVRGSQGASEMLNEPDLWSGFPDQSVSISDEELVIANTAGTQTVTYEKGIHMASLLSFKMKLNYNGDKWLGVSLRHADPSKHAYSTEGYLIVFKSDVIELQRRNLIDGTLKGGVIDTVPNTFFKEAQWCDVEIGAIGLEGDDVTVVLKIDGETVYEYIDIESPVRKNGRFGFIGNAGTELRIKPYVLERNE